METAVDGPWVRVRNSQEPGDVLTLGASGWGDFVSGIKAGRLVRKA